MLLEIDLQGAQQVKRVHPEALVVLLVPPSPEVQAARLRHRGDSEDEVARRIALGAEEERVGRAMTPHVVVNDELDRAVGEVAGIIVSRRLSGDPRPDERQGA